MHDGPNEQSVLSRFLTETHGVVIAHADPRELRVAGDEIYYEDVRVDVVYRDYELRELAALEAELGRPLDAMRLAFRQNRVVSSFVGDFDHKSCWEILTDAAIAERYFSADECRLFRRHVLWTRVVSDRRTTLPAWPRGRSAGIHPRASRAARAQAQPRLWRQGRGTRCRRLDLASGTAC